MLTKKDVPLDIFDSTLTSPFILEINCFTRDKPRPVPLVCALARAHTKGTGLGLSLVKQLISRMNGEVRVESKISKGTSFFVSIPH